MIFPAAFLFPGVAKPLTNHFMSLKSLKSECLPLETHPLRIHSPGASTLALSSQRKWRRRAAGHDKKRAPRRPLNDLPRSAGSIFFFFVAPCVVKGDRRGDDNDDELEMDRSVWRLGGRRSDLRARKRMLMQQKSRSESL
ncbi:hypothetical protein L596_010006 [Steinernema carpocapsae]|uniref:Uncharacterized protein n=1 Tax=Steinernema carpocapsae TaxID=34508 RepID=A0A4U5PH82_STECR|nr:hypothetical protein L596_010006 [Steinernema carpocapsae]